MINILRIRAQRFAACTSEEHEDTGTLQIAVETLLSPVPSVSFEIPMAKVVLGKGLGALISTNKPASPTVEPWERVERVALSDIVPSPLQPRKSFHSEQLQELVESIREHGIIQPLIVRKVEGKCELIAGERRWRAASSARTKRSTGHRATGFGSRRARVGVDRKPAA